ncbi:MAG: flavodoxin [Spirochaetales bacterium]|nr:flavodoxin [Spirochaetales bacterium]
MSKIGIIYGSTTGDTEGAAQKIQSALGSGDVISANKKALVAAPEYDVLLLGSSTWGFGDLEDSWDSLLGEFGKLDLSGKKVGFFGTGDQEGYEDTFVDALGLIHEALVGSGAEFIGSWPVDGYSFSESKAVVDGSFVGLALDEVNQSDKSDERIARWVKLISEQIG